jgi:rare lipoprotein A
MRRRSPSRRWPVLIAAGAACIGLGAPAAFADSLSGEPAAAPKSVEREPVTPKRPDLSGRKRIGTASVYAPMFHGRKMADGNRMSPNDDNAASKTLPLGTEARVTNLKTGRSTTVTIQDRGPYVKGRIVDLSPQTAREIGLTKKEGVVPVEVAPITVPMPDGSVKVGEAARDEGGR